MNTYIKLHNEIMLHTFNSGWRLKNNIDLGNNVISNIYSLREAAAIAAIFDSFRFSIVIKAS